MGYKPKTRFGVNLGGNLCEMFAVRELSNGDLLLKVKMSEQMGPHLSYKNIVDHRFSVHRSLKSPGFTIKQTQSFEDGTLIEEALYHLPNEGVFRAILVARTYPILTEDRYALRPHERDKVVLLPRPSVPEMTPMTIIIVSNVTLPTSDFGPLMMDVTQETFRHFTLTILSAYFLVPAFAQSVFLAPVTSTPRIDGGPTQIIHADLPSPDRERLVELLFLIRSELKTRTLRNLLDYEWSDGGSPDEAAVERMRYGLERYVRGRSD